MAETILVIGNGPIGSSVARSLSDSLPYGGISVFVVGDKGGMSSHDDKGRMARTADAEGSKTWAHRNMKALRMFSSLEERSGVKFFTRCGSICVGDEDFLSPIKMSLDATPGATYERLDSSSLKERFPFVHVADNVSGLYEEEAGYVNPQEMIKSNNKIFVKNGGVVINGSCVSLERDGGKSINVGILKSGQTSNMTADRIIVCCGGLTQPTLDLMSLRLPEPSYRISKRTVCLLEVEPLVSDKLNVMPCMKWQVPPKSSGEINHENKHDAVEENSVYVLPPIKYDDGKMYLKIGGGANIYLDGDVFGDPSGDEWNVDLTRHFNEGGDVEIEENLSKICREHVINVELGKSKPKACFTTCSEDDALRIENVTENVTVVAVCQGKAAAPAPAIGEEVKDFILNTPQAQVVDDVITGGSMGLSDDDYAALPAATRTIYENEAALGAMATNLGVTAKAEGTTLWAEPANQAALVEAHANSLCTINNDEDEE